MTPYGGHAVDMLSCLYVVRRQWLYDSTIYCKYYITAICWKISACMCLCTRGIQVILTAQAIGSCFEMWRFAGSQSQHTKQYIVLYKQTTVEIMFKEIHSFFYLLCPWWSGRGINILCYVLFSVMTMKPQVFIVFIQNVEGPLYIQCKLEVNITLPQDWFSWTDWTLPLFTHMLVTFTQVPKGCPWVSAQTETHVGGSISSSLSVYVCVWVCWEILGKATPWHQMKTIRDSRKVQGSKCDKASESLTEKACRGEWKKTAGSLS